MSSASAKEYDEHQVYLKSLGVDLDSIFNDNTGLSECFKLKLMSAIKRLREAVTRYDSFKGSIMDVADAIRSIFESCTSLIGKNPKLIKIFGRIIL